MLVPRRRLPSSSTARAPASPRPANTIKAATVVGLAVACLVALATTAVAEPKKQAPAADANACISTGKAKPYKNDRVEAGFLQNTCKKPVLLAWCLPQASEPKYRCGYDRKRYFIWRTKLAPGERRFNPFNIPDDQPVEFGACFGNWSQAQHFDGKGGFRCVPDSTTVKPGIKCEAGSKTIKVSVRVLWNSKGLAKAVQVVTAGDRPTRTTISMRTIRKWPVVDSEAKGDEKIPDEIARLPISVSHDGKTKSVSLNAGELSKLACPASKSKPSYKAFYNHGASGFVDEVRKLNLCRPRTGKTLPLKCYRSRRSIVIGVRG